MINFGLVDNGPSTNFLRDMGEASTFVHNQQEMQRAQAGRERLQRAYDPATGRVDPNGMREAYVLGGNINGLADYDRNSAATIAKQQELARGNIEDLSRLVSTVTDEPSYQRARAVAGRMGIDTSHFSENWQEAVADAKMTVAALREPEKAAAPHYFETNDGSQGVVGADGQPRIIYQDPTPKMNFVGDGMGGGQWVQMPGAGAGAASPPPQGGIPPLPPGFQVEGGAGSPAPRGFR